MKKGLYILVGIFAFMFLFTNFVSAYYPECFYRTGDSCPMGYEISGEDCCIPEGCYPLPDPDDTITCNDGVVEVESLLSGGCASHILTPISSDSCYEYCCPTDSCTYLGCSGTYTLPFHTCQPSCALDGFEFSFLPILLTGKIILGCSPIEVCENLPQEECTGGCSWVTSSSSGPCSNINEDFCSYYPGCSASYDCSPSLPLLYQCESPYEDILVPGGKICIDCEPNYTVCDSKGDIYHIPCPNGELCKDNECVLRTENCTNGIDDDCDGLVDCLDSDCDPVCGGTPLCSLQTSCAEDNTVLKISDTTNAHGEVWDGTAYTQYLCCDFTGTHDCDGANKVLGLSDITNAHAEIPENYNADYATNVCFGELECKSFGSLGVAGSCDLEYNIPMVSLYDTTNAHLANFDWYDVKICCKAPSKPELYKINCKKY